jgi:hypothetical protein
MLFYLIGADGRDYGPVDAEIVKNWISRNLANLQTKVRVADVEPPEWKVLGDFPEFANVEPPSLPPPLPESVPPLPVVVLPPENLQLPVPVVVEDCIQDALRTAKPIRIFDCLGRGWNLAGANYWPMFGTGLLIMLCVSAAGMVPYIGGLIQMVVQGIFYGGLIYYFIGKKRGELRRLEDAFSGFRRMTWNLSLCNLVTGLLVFLAMLPGIIIFVISLFFLGVDFGALFASFENALNGVNVPANVPAHAHNFAFSSMEPFAIVGIVVGLLFSFFAWIYFQILWMFSLNLVVDKRIAFWEAMKISRAVVAKQWWRIFGLQLMFGVISFGGFLFCCVGIFFVLPVIFAADIYAYDDLFSGIKTKADGQNGNV